MQAALSADPRERFRLAKKYFLRSMILALFISTAISILTLTIPVYMIQVHQRVTTSKSLDTLMWLSMLALLALFLFAFFEYIRGRIFFRVADAITRMLDVPVLQAVVARSVNAVSPVSQNGMRDLSDLRLFLTGPFVTVPLDMVWAPLLFVVLYAMHPLYALTAVIAAVLLAAVGFLGESLARRPMAEANTAATESLLQVNIAIRHAEVMEAMGMRSAFVRRWRRSQNAVLERLDHGNNRIRILSTSAKALRMCAQVAQLACGAYLVILQQASPTSMIAAMLIMARALLPFEQLVECWRLWVFAASAYGRVRDILDASEDDRQQAELPPPDGPLVVDRLTFLPPQARRPILRNVSFSLEPGEALGVVGPSAAGKSTLARMLVGVWEPTGGGVYLDGNNTYQWNRDSFGRYVGYLPQSVSLIEGTVSDNIARLGDADPADVIAAAKKAGVHELIGALPRGYETVVGDSLYTLSAGQRQRIALARAMFGSPRLLVLDEPNSNLDGDGERALLRAIETMRGSGAIVIMISHKPGIMSVVDKILVLKDGAVDMYGPRDEILRDVAPGRAGGPPTRTAAPEMRSAKALTS